MLITINGYCVDEAGWDRNHLNVCTVLPRLKITLGICVKDMMHKCFLE